MKRRENRGERMNSEFQFLMYQSADEAVSVNTVIHDETIWLNQKAMAELFGCSTDNISLHLKNIFAECSIDYDKNAQVTHDFYAMVQNKFHYAIMGLTAAEIVYTKADRTKENMGLTTWKNAPDGRILKSDVLVAKNYLEEKQIRQLERAVTGYFDYIEDLIERKHLYNGGICCQCE